MSDIQLSEEQKIQIEQNRQKAIERRKQRSHPYKPEVAVSKDNVIKIHGSKYKDSAGGFLIENTTLSQEEGAKQVAENIIDDNEDLPLEYRNCMECDEAFVDSSLWSTFEYSVCNKCRDPQDKHSLITRTEAKNDYLLKDCDLDKREPILKFVLKQNPHNPRWGAMKLYLHVQIEKRALEVWGSEEALIEEKELREEKREKSKGKKCAKQMKELRMQVRSSLYDRTIKKTHKHTFGADQYNEDDDTYTHECECGYSETFEKL